METMNAGKERRREGEGDRKINNEKGENLRQKKGKESDGKGV